MLPLPVLMALMSSGRRLPGVLLKGSAVDFTGGAYFESTDLIDFGPGKTIVLIFDDVTTSVAGNAMIGSGFGPAGSTSRLGWGISGYGGMYWTVFGGGTTSNVGLLPKGAVFGVRVVAATWLSSTSHVRSSLNGGAVADVGNLATTAGGATDGTCRTVIGKGLPGGSEGAFKGKLLAFAVLDTEYSDAALVAVTKYGAGGNRLRLPASVTSDPTALIIWEAGIDWDGISATHVTRGSAPITLTANNSPTLVSMDERFIAASDDNMLDAGPGVTYSGRDWREEFARMRVTTDSTRFGIDAYAASPTAYQLGVDVDGAFSATVFPDVGLVVACKDVGSLSASSKVIDVSNGQQAGSTPQPHGNGGAIIQGLRVPASAAITVASPSVPSTRVVVIGDSIFSGYNALAPLQYAWQLQARRAGIAVSSLAWSGQRMQHMLDGTAYTQSTLVARLTSMFDGSSRNILLLQSVTNDYAAGVQSPSTHATNLDALLTALEALGLPGFESWILGGIQRVAPASEAAVNGFTLGDWRTARAGVAALNPSARTYYAGNTIVSDVNMYTDGIHLTNAANTEIDTWFETEIAA